MTDHHPPEEALFAYSSGNLPDAHARVVEAHALRCPPCARALRQAEQVGGSLLESLTPLPLASDALQHALARLDHAVSPVEPAVPTLESLMQGRWRWRSPGIAMMPLLPRDAGGSRLDLIRVAPGLALLEHDHGGYETSCILKGGYHDGLAEYHAGDFAEAGRGLQHQPRALPGADCVCLIATTGHLRPRSLAGRLLRPLIGM